MITQLSEGGYEGQGRHLHYGKRIDINNPDMITNWCKILGCAKDELKEAVQDVGDSIEAIREYFN